MVLSHKAQAHLPLQVLYFQLYIKLIKSSTTTCSNCPLCKSFGLPLLNQNFLGQLAKMDVGDVVVKPMKDFAKNSIRLVKRCTKPDRKGKTRTRQVSSKYAVP